MLSVNVYVGLGLISLTLSGLTFFISRKKKSNYTEIIAIPILSLVGFLFGDKDSFPVRIQVISFLMVSYTCFYFLLHLISYIYLRIKGPTATESSDKIQPTLITLPINISHEIDARFIEDIPANVDSLIHMSEEIRLLTESFTTSFQSYTNDDDRATALKSYFLGLCYHLASLFDKSTRVHVRMLNGGCYQKYIATCDNLPGREYRDNMKVMSLDNKMIHESFVRKCSLIKTLNPTLHEEGSNRKWKNYLMFALPQIIHDNRPVFSVGISVTRKKNELFYFLNYCEIEAIIGHYIDSIVDNKQCHIKEFVERFYFSSG